MPTDHAPTVVLRAVSALEARANAYETALLKVQDAVTLNDAKAVARRAIREAYFPRDEPGVSAGG